MTLNRYRHGMYMGGEVLFLSLITGSDKQVVTVPFDSMLCCCGSAKQTKLGDSLGGRGGGVGAPGRDLYQSFRFPPWSSGVLISFCPAVAWSFVVCLLSLPFFLFGPP